MVLGDRSWRRIHQRATANGGWFLTFGPWWNVQQPSWRLFPSSLSYCLYRLRLDANVWLLLFHLWAVCSAALTISCHISSPCLLSCYQTQPILLLVDRLSRMKLIHIMLCWPWNCYCRNPNHRIFIFLYNLAMFSRVPYFLFLLMETICSITSSNADTPGTEILPSHDFELNGISLPSETQGGANELDIDATDPTKYAWESSEARLIIQGNNDQCPYEYNNQNSRRKSRFKRADSSCSPMIDNGQPAVQDSTDRKKTRPGFQWQIVPQTTTENGSGNQKPGRQAPYSDQNRCPRTAPFPVCAFSTVATIRPDPSYPDTGSTVGRWILDYCRCKYLFLCIPFRSFAVYFSPRRGKGTEDIQTNFAPMIIQFQN